MQLPPASESRDGHVLYRHIAGLIRREIEEGRYRPGDRIATVEEMSAQFHIAAMTARSSLRLLRTEGLLTSVQGKGTFVTDHEPRTDTAARVPGCGGCLATEELLGAIRQLAENLVKVEAELQQRARCHAA
jgi:DNA-binding FadR family transcriptional regulator